MTPWMGQFLSVVTSWLIGSIPFSLLIGRIVGGIDLRQHGSGNVGATNVARTMGAKWGILALLLDAAKGALPVWLLPMLFQIPPHSQINVSVMCGIAAILGHMFPPWLGFRGGKGVATALGVVTVLAPGAMGCAFLAFAVTFAISRIVSLSSMVASLVFAIAQIVIAGPELWLPQSRSLGIFSIAVPLLIVLRHRTNIVRLWRGEEKQLRFSKSDQVPPASGSDTGRPDASPPGT
ncbi:glycerol-3-phosphate 1-O-acyltransferase PlsY [Planctomicrobium sp. SH661]|uniref:glycerol-3-phosphate 1-O-acyltransferase PlsY n=1 Tax=Planctomicrobium sp. SH661 TaxID=3448124 RepID=UPI003F5B74F5